MHSDNLVPWRFFCETNPHLRMDKYMTKQYSANNTIMYPAYTINVTHILKNNSVCQYILTEPNFQELLQTQKVRIRHEFKLFNWHEWKCKWSNDTIWHTMKLKWFHELQRRHITLLHIIPPKCSFTAAVAPRGDCTLIQDDERRWY